MPDDHIRGVNRHVSRNAGRSQITLSVEIVKKFKAFDIDIKNDRV
jgi:hypothetical protein